MTEDDEIISENCDTWTGFNEVHYTAEEKIRGARAQAHARTAKGGPRRIWERLGAFARVQGEAGPRVGALDSLPKAMGFLPGALGFLGPDF